MEELISRLSGKICGNYYVISGTYNDLRRIIPLLTNNGYTVYFIDCTILIPL